MSLRVIAARSVDRDRTARVSLALVAIVALVLRLRELDAASLWYDELFGLVLAQQPFDVVLDVIGGFVANMALYLVLMHVWMALIDPNVSDALPRIPSVVFGVAGVWAMYLLGSELLGRRVGVAAALLLAVSPYHVGWSQDARSYTLWTLLVTLSYWALVRATRSPRTPEWWMTYVLVLTLAFYSHLFTVFIAISQGVWILARRSMPELRGFAASGAGLVLLLTPLIIFGMSNTDGSQLRHVPLPDWKDAQLLIRAYAGGEWAQIAYSLLIVLGALGLAVRSPVPEGRSVLLLLALWLLISPLLVLGLSFLYKPLFRERYVFSVLPALCLLAAASVGRWRLAWFGVPLIAGLTLLSTEALMDGVAVRRDEDWRSAVRYLVDRAEPDDGYIFISRRNHLPWQYYAPRYGKDPFAIHDIEPFDWHELARSRTYRAPAFSRDDLDDFSNGHRRIWLVLSHEFDAYEGGDERGDTAAWVRDRLTRTGFSARQRAFPSIRILLYEKRR